MSRTDKDKPYWIADSYREVHDWRCNVGYSDCDLPEGNPPKFDTGFWLKRYSRCYLDPIHDDPFRQWWQAPPPKWYRDHDWNNPERVKVRDHGRSVIAEHRAYRNSDNLAWGHSDNSAWDGGDWDFPNYQHRHRSAWSYW